MIKTDLNVSVGKSIRALRELNGWSQEVISKQLNISIPAFSKIETGVTDVNLSRLEQIAHIFEVNLANLVTANSKQGQNTPSPVTEMMQKQLLEKDAEIVSLQRKVISLYEQIQEISNKAQE